MSKLNWSDLNSSFHGKRSYRLRVSFVREGSFLPCLDTRFDNICKLFLNVLKSFWISSDFIKLDNDQKHWKSSISLCSFHYYIHAFSWYKIAFWKVSISPNWSQLRTHGHTSITNFVIAHLNSWNVRFRLMYDSILCEKN